MKTTAARCIAEKVEQRIGVPCACERPHLHRRLHVMHLHPHKPNHRYDVLTPADRCGPELLETLLAESVRQTKERLGK